MKKINDFFKNFKNKLYVKLVEIILDAEKPQLPKELRNNLDIFFELFDELKFSEKILVGIIFSISTVYMIFWIWKFYSIIFK